VGYFWTIVALIVALGITWRYLGSYMAAVFDGRVHFLGWVERPIYRALGTSPEHEQTWKRYAGSLIIFSAVSLGLTYLIFRIQGSLPLNPQHLGAVPPALSFNTAVSFLTNTNWQAYGGETTMSYFSQITLVVQQFVSPAVGIVAALVLVRGFSRRKSSTIGNFWVDLTRCLFYILLPIAFIGGIIFVGQGAVETLAGTVSIRDALNGVTQTIARGPIGFMEAIKQLGTNGGGFLDQNGATPFENPTGLTNLLSIYLILSIPVALTYTFGKMVGSIRHGATLLVAMLVIFGSFLFITSYAEHQGNPAVAAAGIVSQPTGNMEGKEVRFGDTATALYGVTSTNTSTGSVDSSEDSYNPMGGFAMLGGMMLGEVSPRGHGDRPLHNPLSGHHRGVHQWPDDRANARVSRQENPGQGDQTCRPRGARDAAHRAHLDGHRGIGPCRTNRPAQRRAARVQRDPLRVCLRGQQQRIGVRRHQRQHALLQHRRGD
jgi:K+-transporting ATPase ATPase A chain